VVDFENTPPDWKAKLRELSRSEQTGQTVNQFVLTGTTERLLYPHEFESGT
jgi:hypothetical protein